MDGGEVEVLDVELELVRRADGSTQVAGGRGGERGGAGCVVREVPCERSSRGGRGPEQDGKGSGARAPAPLGFNIMEHY